MNPLSLASGVLPEFGASVVIEAARSAGFDAAGIWVDPAEWTTAQSQAARDALTATGLPLLDVEVVWIKPGEGLDAHRRIIDIGADLGAADVLCVSSHPDPAATAAALEALCHHAEGSGMRVALEFGVFTQVKNLTQARAIIEMVGHPLGAILVDPIHVDRSGTSIEQIAQLDPALVPYAQFCDASARRPDPDDFDAVILDAVDLREQCGQGALPLEAMLAALPVDIPLSVELRSLALRTAYPDPMARACAVAQATRDWFGRRRDLAAGENR
ncbi:sugar phosphate isomerase/epimerase family protein [Sphingobium subterraneum]|uniref:Sugar phosphate isomerase/epimerase n=1 Tax=Sphingobium subterraneum TaxID=627688 RepID=A0A841J088_9SPHN|nr:TIM barrel protein [Sphingobium subterraneum]MBB6124010.1 sugar phosphate isomerase/epimerase [Sphingobium subterraneum]